MAKKRPYKRRFLRGRKYDFMAKYAYSLGFDNVTDAINFMGSGRIFRNSFNEWCKYKRLK
tara:strand:+ start:24812 stop:24991 length:180 start_codon:yes stop_codon:yes gene_type:complete